MKNEIENLLKQFLTETKDEVKKIVPDVNQNYQMKDQNSDDYDELMDTPYEFNIFDKQQFNTFLIYSDILSLFYFDRHLDMNNLEKDLADLFDEIIKVNGKHPYYVYMGIFRPIAKAIDNMNLITYDDISNDPDMNFYHDKIALAVYNTLVDIYANDPDGYYPIGSLNDIFDTIIAPEYQKDRVKLSDEEADKYEKQIFFEEQVKQARENGVSEEAIQEYLKEYEEMKIQEKEENEKIKKGKKKGRKKSK